VSIRDEAIDYLRNVGEADDDRIDLAATALRLAAAALPAGEQVANPLDSLAPFDAHLAEIADAVAVAAAPAEDLAGRLVALNGVLIDRFGYTGDRETYDDLDNANMLRVIERRRGLPVALGILYIHAARAQGWKAEGLNFPGHFLIRMDAPGERAVVDPFNGGSVRTVPELRELLKASAGPDAELGPAHYEAVGNRDVLLRLQNNIKLRYLAVQRVEAAAGILDTMLLVAPRTPSLWREAGILHAYLGNLTRAIGALDTFLGFGPGGDAAAEAARLLRQLRSKLN